MARRNVPRIEPYNPLDKRNLGESITDAMLETMPSSLPPNPFIGAGVYALYYIGSFPAYAKLAEKNRDGKYLCPIYIGKAVPSGARKGGHGRRGFSPARTARMSCLDALRNISIKYKL